MERKKEYPRRTGPGNTDAGNTQRSNNAPREGYKPVQEQQIKNFREIRENHENRENRESRETRENREVREVRENRENREGSVRFGHHNQNVIARHQRIKVEETIDDIKEDITRIEKEINLEIKEIKSLKLGL